MSKAFQTNAFQTTYPGLFYAFQAQDLFVSFGSDPRTLTLYVREFLEIAIGPIMLEYARGTAVVLESFIFDPSQKPPIPFNPDSVQINILNPDGTSLVSLGSMSLINTGFFRYVYQTTGANQLGIFKANIKATSGANVAQTESQVVFKLVSV